jgi:hypothetical protein
VGRKGIFVMWFGSSKGNVKLARTRPVNMDMIRKKKEKEKKRKKRKESKMCDRNFTRGICIFGAEEKWVFFP